MRQCVESSRYNSGMRDERIEFRARSVNSGTSMGSENGIMGLRPLNSYEPLLPHGVTLGHCTSVLRWPDMFGPSQH